MKRQFFQIFKALYLYKKRHPKRVMTFLVFIVVPLVTGLILGYEMSSDVATAIPTVVVNHDQSEFSRNLVAYVDESNYFNVVEEADNDARVEEALYNRQAYVGLIIPENFYSDMREGKAPKILTVYDGSSLAVISSSKSAMSEILLTLKAGYMIKNYEGKLDIAPAEVRNHAIPIDATYRLLYNPTRNFRNFILPGMLAALIQVGIACMGAERASENRGKGLAFTEHLKMILKWGSLGAVSISLTLIEQYLLFDMPYKGTLLGGIVLTVLFSCVIFALGYLVGSILSDRMFASQVAAVLVLPASILGGYTWPALAMPTFFQWLAKIIPFYYYGNRIRDLCLKDLAFRHLIPDIRIMLIFIAVELVLLYFIKKKEVLA
ncbi:ABC transporter permease [Anoxybacterium hadale]|uniref:ABC transporter permease n=1 Tax=Anoxybacterium hadale TaxID=3408580 RepID=A0ACD1AE52_9FIRM|nr:ABC transporter permease [Clostridiales bacterium]